MEIIVRFVTLKVLPVYSAHLCFSSFFHRFLCGFCRFLSQFHFLFLLLFLLLLLRLVGLWGRGRRLAFAAAFVTFPLHKKLAGNLNPNTTLRKTRPQKRARRKLRVLYLRSCLNNVFIFGSYGFRFIAEGRRGQKKKKKKREMRTA